MLLYASPIYTTCLRALREPKLEEMKESHQPSLAQHAAGTATFRASPCPENPTLSPQRITTNVGAIDQCAP